MTLRIFDAGSSEYSDGGTVVTVSGTTDMGVGVAGGGAGAEAMVAAAGAEADAVADETIDGAATGAALLAAHPSFPRNWIDGLLASLTAVGNIVVLCISSACPESESNQRLELLDFADPSGRTTARP